MDKLPPVIENFFIPSDCWEVCYCHLQIRIRIERCRYCFGLDWISVMSFIANIGVTEEISLFFNEFIDHVTLSESRVIYKDFLLSVLKNDYLIHICQKWLGAQLLLQVLVCLIISVHQIPYRTNFSSKQELLSIFLDI